MRSRLARLMVLATAWGLLTAVPAGASVDRSRAVSATIGPGGGILSTIAADGSAFQLTVPPRALAGDERLTITPLRARLPWGLKPLAAVQLQPAGLRLLAPATLAVHPAFRGVSAQRVAFGVVSGQPGLVPLSARGALQLPVLRLGSYGLASAGPAQLAAAERNPPADPESAWLEQLAAAQHARTGVRSMLAGYYANAIAPLLGASTFRAWEHATARAVAWEREAKLLGYSRGFGAQRRRISSTLLGSVARRLARRLQGTCARGLARLSAVQQALVLSGVARVGAGSLAACAQGLGVQVSLGLTHSTWQSADSGDRVATVATLASSAAVPLSFVQSLGAGRLAFAATAQAPLSEQLQSDAIGPTYAAQGCSGLALTGYSSAIAFGATLTIPADLFDGAAPPPARIALTASGSDVGSWTMTCPPGQTVSFQQSTGVLPGLSAVTAVTPISLSAARRRATFSGSADILQGNTIAAFANERGSVTVAFPR